jgi:hypothetical protein
MAPTAESPERVWPRARSAADDTSGPPALSDRLPRAWLFPLLVFAATWVVILATWFGSDLIYHHSESWTWYFLFKDAGWFETVAQHGYPARMHPGLAGESVAFFPAFPLLIRAGMLVAGGSLAFGGLAVMVLTGAASATGVWALADRVCGRRVADRAVVLYCFFPGAMTFGMLYSEPLTVTLAAAALLALVSRRWLLAGIIGAVATAEASILIVLAAVSGIAALQAIWARREWRALIAPALTPLGILAFFGYLGHRYHDYAFWFQVERSGWHQHIDWGAHTLSILFWTGGPAFNQQRFLITLYIVMLAVAAVGIILMLAARLPVPVSLYGVLIVLAFTLSPANPRPRYVLCAFPLLIGYAAKLPRVLYWPLLAVSAATLVFLVGWFPNHSHGPAP